LPGHVEKTVSNVDWLGCLQACHNEPQCISYNYWKENKTCEINSNGIQEQCESGKPTIFSRGWIFHQIRPAPEKLIVPELGGHPSTAATSCKEILDKRRAAPSGAYYIETIPGKTSLIYCKMERTAECGDGGWTLAMKINGSKATFSYDSALWTNVVSYNESGGTDLSSTETKSAVFGYLTLKEGFCVGMKVKGDTKWLKINYRKGSSAVGIFMESYGHVSIGRSQWKPLINGSYMPEDCSSPKEGFNVAPNGANGARARIGLVGHKDCNQPADSRIGFGTDGDNGGMDPSNTCGNEATDVSNGGVTSIKAFCYIFIK